MRKSGVNKYKVKKYTNENYRLQSYDVDRYKIKKYTNEYYQLQLYNVDKYQLLRYSSDAKRTIKSEDTCDKIDYIVAIACGAIGGLIDIFLVGTPGDSKLGKWTDKQVDDAVMKFAKKLGWNPKEGNKNNVKSAIGYLEHGKNSGTEGQFQGFKVNYDQRKPSDVSDKFVIAPQTHHMMSLGHSPDIIGLFFSILNQFTNTASFISNGQLITIDTKNYQLYGNNFIMKLLCGLVNWVGHLMSDVAGSSGAHSRGTGIVIPFYELFGFCKFGSFLTKEGIKDLAQLTQAAYTHGYDTRYGMAMAIPVLITDLSIRLIWGIRQYFQFEKTIKECIPTEKTHPDLRIMLLFGQGTLCLFDVIDAGVESGGCALTFFMRLNLVAWFRFATLVFKEICIRLKMSNAEQINTNAYEKISEELVFDDNGENSFDKKKNTMVINTFKNARNSKDVEIGLIEII